MIDQEDVVASAPDQGVRSGPAVEDVVAAGTVEHVRGGVAGEGIRARVTGPPHRCAEQDQVLHLGREGVADRGLNRVGAAVRRLDHYIGGVNRAGSALSDRPALMACAMRTCRSLVASSRRRVKSPPSTRATTVRFSPYC